ncbi:MAG: RnfABCDGE type electron transport complex subunit D [Acholeplasmataceae bacterium]
MEIAQRNRIIVASALFLLLIAASVIFGPTVFIVGVVAIATSLIIELLNSKLRKEKFDWTSFAISPLIITLMTTPVIIDHVWMVVVATAFGVFFAKAIFGGEGKYIFNPATVGLIFIAISFPVEVNSFIDPVSKIISTETPATLFKTAPNQLADNFTFLKLLMGNYAGGIGTTFKLGILILGGLLMVLKITDWKIPLTFVGTYFLISLVNFLTKGYGLNSFSFATYSILVGHLMFASMFIAGDPQTAPLYPKGVIIYGVLLGLLTWLIQNLWLFNEQAPNTEGAIYSITFMNAVVGLLDEWTVPKIKEIPLVEEE